MIYYGISLLLVYIQVLCGMKSIYPRIETRYAFTPDMKKNSLKNSIRVNLLKEVLH